MASQVHSRNFTSRQGVNIRLDFMYEKPDDDVVFYAGVYVEAPDWKLYPDSEVKAVIISVHPTGNTEIPVTLKYFTHKGKQVLYGAPISGVINARLAGQIAVVVNKEWQEDRWQPGVHHNFNFQWKP